MQEMTSVEIPQYWRSFRDASNLLKTSVEIPEDMDLSELGADIEFFDDENILDEANNFYPGCVVIKHGFLPVGGCQIGSGDPYFILTSEGEGGRLYRIYHDSVPDEEYSRADAVDIVLEDYREILSFIEATQ